MKKNFTFSLILLIYINVSAQLRWLNPIPSGWPNQKIHFINESTGYLMNFNGDLFITRDTGNKWEKHSNFPGGQTFHFNNSTGIVPCFDSSVYISRDNGSTWFRTISHPGKLIDNSWADIVGSDTLFVTAYNNSGILGLYRSVNSGNSWENIMPATYPITTTSIDFITSQRGYALRPDGVFKTTNGGSSWQSVYTISSSAIFTSLKFYDTLRGIAYREQYGMLRTTNGGATWTPGTGAQPTQDVFDIVYIDSLNLYSCGDYGTIYKSTDGGNSWTWAGSTSNTSEDNLYTAYFFNVNSGIVAGKRGRVLKTRDGGASWQWPAPTYTDITGISFGNNTTGYATTWNNSYKTVDSGKTWTSLAFTATGLNTRFEHCIFFNRDTGIVTTRENVKLYKTINGGQSWTTFDPTTQFGNQFWYISSISFINKDTGYASLRGSVPPHGIFKTVNGGSTWSEVGTEQNFHLLFFLTDKFGYGTFYDRVYRTLDGGMNWTMSPVPPANYGFNSMWFLNAKKGFTVGDHGQLKMTTDSAYHWTDIILEPFALPQYKTISFYNDRIGYITDKSGNYFRTIDSGYHWKRQGNTPYMCDKILFRPDSTVLFAGINGQIVSRDIADFSIDSIKVTADECKGLFHAKISAVLSTVDSIWFQYGKNDFTGNITGTPMRVADTSINITATASDLQPDTLYRMRVKILFRNNYYYSTDFIFTPKKAVAPVITASGNILSSTVATDNQWYLNGTIIPGATNQQYTATVSGNYTVIAVSNGCATLSSLPYNLTVTAIPNVNIPGAEIQLYPNPVVNEEINIIVRSNRHLMLQITDLAGRKVLEKTLISGTNNLQLHSLQKGMYLFIISDTKTFEAAKRKVLKLQ